MHYEGRRKTRRAAIDAVISKGLVRERARNVEVATKVLLDRGGPTPTAAWVLTRAVNGVLCATSEEDSPLLSKPELEDERVRLVQGFLSAAAKSTRATS